MLSSLPMSYIDKNLLENEQVLYKTTLHWIIFAWPTFWIIAVFCLLFLVPSFQFFQVMGTVGFLFSLYLWAVAAIQYFCSEFGITNQRVLIKTGLIRIFSFELLLTRVESIKVYQSIPGRILGYGSIAVIGTGGSRNLFNWINDPLTFRKKVQEQIEKRTSRPA